MTFHRLIIKDAWTTYEPFHRPYFCETPMACQLKFRTIIIKSMGHHEASTEEELLALALNGDFWDLVKKFEKYFKCSVEIKRTKTIKKTDIEKELDKVKTKYIIKEILE